MKTKKIILLLLIILISMGVLCTASSASTHKITNKGEVKGVATIITITAKPSCGCNNTYKWYTTSFYNYCPNCKKVGGLEINPKNVPEGELTCKYCDCDYCGVCGKEKIKGSTKYLTKA